MDQKSSDDRELDEALEETFPASDPPANTVVTGTHLAVEPLPAGVTDDRDTGEVEPGEDQTTVERQPKHRE
jgi:hypothetical protein